MSRQWWNLCMYLKLQKNAQYNLSDRELILSCTHDPLSILFMHWDCFLVCCGKSDGILHPQVFSQATVIWSWHCTNEFTKHKTSDPCRMFWSKHCTLARVHATTMSHRWIQLQQASRFMLHENMHTSWISVFYVLVSIRLNCNSPNCGCTPRYFKLTPYLQWYWYMHIMHIGVKMNRSRKLEYHSVHRKLA